MRATTIAIDASVVVFVAVVVLVAVVVFVAVVVVHCHTRNGVQIFGQFIGFRKLCRLIYWPRWMRARVRVRQEMFAAPHRTVETSFSRRRLAGRFCNCVRTASSQAAAAAAANCDSSSSSSIVNNDAAPQSIPSSRKQNALVPCIILCWQLFVSIPRTRACVCVCKAFCANTACSLRTHTHTREIDRSRARPADRSMASSRKLHSAYAQHK